MQPLDLATAQKLLDLSGGDAQLAGLANLQLEGAVALHNMLADPEVGVGYLADEVGMGKTYVALGVVALMRYFNPGLRVLYICPSRNVQEKWFGREHPNFIQKNVLTRHFRIRTPQGEPGTPAISCANIEELIHATTTGYYGDIFVRMSSFSMSMGEEEDDLRQRLDWLRDQVPASVLGKTRASKADVKETYARAVNYLLPEFDLVVIDEAHNFKHAFDSSTRNQALSRILGFNPDGAGRYQRRAKLALLLSATPFDLNPLHLYNQLAMVGRAHLMPDAAHWGDRQQLKAALARFMVRRLNVLDIAGKPHTRNMYRREWRKGERAEIDFASDEHKLVTALVQKHVGDMLNREGGNPSFQLGLLASFESYAQTARSGPVEFDGDKPLEGVQDARDRHLVAVIRDSYVDNEFGPSLPHPKMDQVSRELALAALTKGRKQLVFVRRVRSVPELKQKLDEHYNEWLQLHIRNVLGGHGQATVLLELVFARYAEVAKRLDEDISGGEVQALAEDEAERIPPKNDTLFNWFFRGETPAELTAPFAEAFRDWPTPDALKKSLVAKNNANALLFEFNWAALVARECLGETPASLLAGDVHLLQAVIDATRPVSEGDQISLFLSVQQAFLRALAARYPKLRGLAELADYLGHQLPTGDFQRPDSTRVRAQLSLETFFCHLHRAGLSEACFSTPAALARHIVAGETGLSERIHRVEIHRQLVAQALRTGHPWVDLYLARLQMGGGDLNDTRRQLWMRQYCELVEAQRGGEAFSTFMELSLLNDNLDLVIKSNLPGVFGKHQRELRLWLNQTLPSSAPIIGADGKTYASRSVQARKFRMPGYPLVLVSTDVFQEGEDLHTFCDSVVHYGLSSSPIGIEQKTGRVDRVGAASHRRLLALREGEQIADDDFIQVRFPFVKQSIEAIQVRTLCHNLNSYLATLHEIGGSGITIDEFVDASRELASRNEIPDQLLDFLQSPYVPTLPRGHRPELRAAIDAENERVGAALAHIRGLVVEVAGGTPDRNGLLRPRSPALESLELQVMVTSARSCGEMLLRAKDDKKLDFHPPSQWTTEAICQYQGELYTTGLARTFADREGDGIALYRDAEMLLGDSGVTCAQDLAGFLGRFTTPLPERFRALQLAELPIVDEGQVNDYLSSWYHWQGKLTIRSGRSLELVFHFGAGKGRRHRIAVRQGNGFCVFEAQVADCSQVKALSRERLLNLTWIRNRNIDMVEFLVRPDGCLVGRTFHPLAAMGFEECIFCAYVLAVEADRLEYLVKEPDEY